MKDRGYSLVHNWNYIGLSVVIVATLTLMVIYWPELTFYDSMILDSIQKILAPYPTEWIVFLMEFGRANYLLWPQIAVCSVLLSHRLYFKAFMVVFMMQVVSVILTYTKPVICRVRPCGDAYPGYSFPSGHSITTTCLYGIVIWLILYYVSNKFWKYFLVTIFSLFIFFVLLSRVWLNYHYLTDVLAGFFLGFILVNLYIIICRKMNL